MYIDKDILSVITVLPIILANKQLDQKDRLSPKRNQRTYHLLTPQLYKLQIPQRIQ